MKDLGVIEPNGFIGDGMELEGIRDGLAHKGVVVLAGPFAWIVFSGSDLEDAVLVVRTKDSRPALKRSYISREALAWLAVQCSPIHDLLLGELLAEAFWQVMVDLAKVGDRRFSPCGLRSTQGAEEELSGRSIEEGHLNVLKNRIVRRHFSGGEDVLGPVLGASRRRASVVVVQVGLEGLDCALHIEFIVDIKASNKDDTKPCQLLVEPFSIRFEEGLEDQEGRVTLGGDDQWQSTGRSCSNSSSRSSSSCAAAAAEVEVSSAVADVIVWID